MSNSIEQYLCQPIEKPITDDDAKVDLIRSKDHPIMSFFYESAFYRKPYVICDKEYALPYDELFCFASTTDDDKKLGAKISFTVNGEKFETDRTFMIQIPAFVPHGPIEITEMETPIFSYVTGMGLEHRSLPKQSWHPELALPMEEMVIFYNGDDAGDPHVEQPQKWLIRSIRGKTTKGECCGALRRFYKTDGWVYAKDSHVHNNPEILAYYGTDPWHPYELNGEYTQYLNGKPITFNKPTVVFIPSYVPHCPIVVHKLPKDNYWHSLGLATGPINSKPEYRMDYITVESAPFEMEEPW